MLTLGAVGTIAVGAGMVTDNPGLVTGAVTGTLLTSAGAIALNCQHRRRLELADMYLLKLSPQLGWPAPDRKHLTVSGWRGGWIGTPKRIKIRFNPLADESAPQIVAEARRLAKRLFGTRYRATRQDDRKGILVLTRLDSAAESNTDVQIERVKTLTSKIFGADSTCKTRFADSGELREITVTFEVSHRLASAALRARIETQISAMLHGRWRAFWDLQNDTVRLELRPQLKTYIPNPNIAPDVVDPLKTYDELEVPVAIDEDGNTIVWKPKDDPHGIVTGKTGKGKTVALLNIVMYLAACGWKVWGIDGKRIELLGLRSHPNVQLLAGRVDHQARVAHEMYEMMQRRFEQYEAGLVKLEDFEPVLFVIDEYKTFRNAVTAWYRTVKPKGASTVPATLNEISDFVSLARKARMHLMLGLQRPDAEFLTGDMRDNFNFRMSFGRLSPDAAKMMWDSFSTGVTIPLNAKGRGMAVNRDGVPVEVQAYWTPDPYQTDPENPDVWVFPNDLQIIEQLQPKVRLHENMRIIDPEDTGDWVDLDGKDDKDAPNFNDYMDARITTVSAADAAPKRRMAGVFESSSKVAVLERITTDNEEPEIPDEDELFAGYSPAQETGIDDLLGDDGTFEHEGALVLVDEGSDSWGLIDFLEVGLDDEGDVEISYRDFATGEPGSLSVPGSEPLVVRLPDAGVS
ncbi:FtsK/SpoIIIE domain-containing protein [Clavibacter sepedonicus]|uniref:FtsK/SpoIIIE domain-containing protein n=1 Tax=Clavibacter TaxID=1573 RepID=UPI0002D84B77|nr:MULTISPECIES: FtsK/SpoIIIE domain-containing protein [Clavibacter]MBD5382474.1 cell division protein FtsK [Clavibacter sp.]UUK67226.1 cell division protein FtsK [Clavibacter sepedonicus]